MPNNEKSNIYFVESINFIKSDTENGNDEYNVVLLDVTKDSGKGYENNLNFKILDNLTEKQIESIKEGQFVFYNYENNIFSNANGSKIAKQHILANNIIRSKLNYYQEKNNTAQIVFQVDSQVFSYHINVGHGNCSIIVINGDHFWLVDCSNHDYMNKTCYDQNINSCLDALKIRFKISNIVFEKVFISHTHFDHYSGVLRLINDGHINNQTELYLNYYYSCLSKNWTNLLSRIYETGCPIIEPTGKLQSNPNIEIWNPEIRTLRTKSKINRNYPANNVPFQIVSRVNNSSVLYCFKIGSKTILFTGDLETQQLDKLKHCFNDLDYYVVSHHGSINGHLRNHCPLHNNIKQVTDCIKKDSIKILMGRDNAYKGIYSAQVVNDCCKLCYTEKNDSGNLCKFFEIDWQSSDIQYEL